MSQLPSLVDSSGRPIRLDRQLGAGGEGAVYALANNADLAAKVYSSPQTPQKEEKLAAMAALASPRLQAVATWPSGLLFDMRTRKMVGFVMPRLNNSQPIQHLYNPVMRLKFFPRAGWSFQIRAAQNLAAAFDEVHKVGCIMGDVNQSNEHVTLQALVRLIDCDSFQLKANGKQYLCDVGVPHYTPPELQGKPLRGVVRTENHDRFGLAVLIYQLLFVGRHPYAGIYRGSGDPPFDQLIAEYRFTQGPLARTWGMEPPPHTPTFSDIPPDVAMLFRRAFERGSENGSRPRPAEWIPALRQLEENTVACATDEGHKYWRKANGCVWCRLAVSNGPEYYFGVAGDVGTFTVNEAKLQEVQRRMAAARMLDFPYEPSRFAPPRSPEPAPLPTGLDDHRNISIILGAATILCVLALPLGLIRGFICVIAALAAIVFGTWFGIQVAYSPLQQEHRRRRKALSRAKDFMEENERQWNRRVESYQRDHDDLRRGILNAVMECRNLPTTYEVELRKATANAEEMARLRHLRLHLIADAEIPNIGANRKQVLASYNVLTAADLDRHTVRNIKGFGDKLTSNLMAWRDKVLREFRFDPKSSLTPAELKSVASSCRQRQQQLLASIDRDLIHLESLAPSCRVDLEKIVPSIQDAVVELEQAEADYRLLRQKE